MPNDSQPKRITMQTIWEYVLAIFNLERGLLYTIGQLTLRPGQAIKEFLFTEKRNKHIKPISFVILSVTVTTFLTLKLFSNDIGLASGISIGIPKDATPFVREMFEIFNQLMTKYLNLIQMLKIPFLSIATFWLFRKNKYNFAEHLVINSYIYSYLSVCIVILLLGLSFSLSINSMGSILAFLSFAYPIYVYIKLFEENLILSILKSIGSFLLGSILHLIFIGLITLIFYQFSLSF